MFSFSFFVNTVLLKQTVPQMPAQSSTIAFIHLFVIKPAMHYLALTVVHPFTEAKEDKDNTTESQ